MRSIRYATSPAPWVPSVILYHADCLPVLRSLQSSSITTCVSDPPYGLSDVNFAGTIQALTAWANGDRERVPDGKGMMGLIWDKFVPPPAVWDECFRILKPGGYMAVFAGSRTADLMGLSIRLAGFTIKPSIFWIYSQGFSRTKNELKPASEPIIIAQKPGNAGILNIDGCRVPIPDRKNYEAKCASVVGLSSNRNGATYSKWTGVRENSSSDIGRWPANVVLSHSEHCDMETCVHGCPVAELGEPAKFYNVFRYQAKAPKSERPVVNGVAHPTVKPRALAEWLITLFTPPYGLILDPFTGSGTIGEAALRLGFNSIIIERDQKYWPLIDKRLNDYLDTVKAKAS